MATKAKKTVSAPLADLADKEPTIMHQTYADWIAEQTGVDVDVKSIQLGTLLRGAFQKSEVNQERMAASQAAKAEAAEAREAQRQARAEAKAAKEAEREEKRAAREAAKADKPVAKKTAAPAAKKTAVKAPAKKAAPARRRPAKG